MLRRQIIVDFIKQRSIIINIFLFKFRQAKDLLSLAWNNKLELAWFQCIQLLDWLQTILCLKLDCFLLDSNESNASILPWRKWKPLGQAMKNYIVLICEIVMEYSMESGYIVSERILPETDSFRFCFQGVCGWIGFLSSAFFLLVGFKIMGCIAAKIFVCCVGDDYFRRMLLCLCSSGGREGRQLDKFWRWGAWRPPLQVENTRGSKRIWDPLLIIPRYHFFKLLLQFHHVRNFLDSSFHEKAHVNVLYCDRYVYLRVHFDGYILLILWSWICQLISWFNLTNLYRKMLWKFSILCWQQVLRWLSFSGCNWIIVMGRCRSFVSPYIRYRCFPYLLSCRLARRFGFLTGSCFWGQNILI